MKKYILDFLGRLLAPWFVSQECLLTAERHIDKLHEELNAIYESHYKSRYQFMSQLNEVDKVVEIKTENLKIDAIRFHWEVNISRKAWVLFFDPKQELEIVREKIIHKIVSEFYDNIKKQLQWDT